MYIEVYGAEILLQKGKDNSTHISQPDDNTFYKKICKVNK